MTYSPLGLLGTKAEGMTAQKVAARIRAGTCEAGSSGVECCVLFWLLLFGGGPGPAVVVRGSALLRGLAQGQVLYVVCHRGSGTV